MDSTRPLYQVTTWDGNKQEFTPQQGVRRGPYTKWGLRRALRKLRAMGYAATRLPHAPGDGGCGDPSVLVERVTRG